MSINVTKKRGIPCIDRVNTQSLMIFGAVHFARMQQPEESVSETVARVIKAFGLEITAKAAERRYFFVANAYLGNPDEE